MNKLKTQVRLAFPHAKLQIDFFREENILTRSSVVLGPTLYMYKIFLFIKTLLYCNFEIVRIQGFISDYGLMLISW